MWAKVGRRNLEAGAYKKGGEVEGKRIRKGGKKGEGWGRGKKEIW